MIFEVLVDASFYLPEISPFFNVNIKGSVFTMFWTIIISWNRYWMSFYIYRDAAKKIYFG